MTKVLVTVSFEYLIASYFELTADPFIESLFWLLTGVRNYFSVRKIKLENVKLEVETPIDEWGWDFFVDYFPTYMCIQNPDMKCHEDRN